MEVSKKDANKNWKIAVNILEALESRIVLDYSGLLEREVIDIIYNELAITLEKGGDKNGN